MRLDNHFVILLYPFRHALPDQGPRRAEAVKPLSECWRPWWRRLSSAQVETALDDSFFFLPHVRQLLFPEAVELDRQRASHRSETPMQWRLEKLATELEPHSLLRLTYSQPGLSALEPLKLQFQLPDGKGGVVDEFSSEAHIDWIDVALFPQRVGLLMLKLFDASPSLTSEHLLDFMYYARQVQQQKIGWVMPHWSVDRDGVDISFTSRDLVDFLLQGLGDGGTTVDLTLQRYVERLARGEPVQRYSTTDQGQVYGQSFHLFSYACLGHPEPCDGSPADTFASPADQVLYELATSTPASDPLYRPDANYVKRLLERDGIAFWHNWKALALHDNAVFLGTEPSTFTLRDFAHNVEWDYLHTYLITLYQKLRLDWLSGELMRRGASLAQDLTEARAVTEEFAAFRNHYWFTDVTFKPHGIELYQRFQHGLGVEPLFHAVRQAVGDLKEHYEGREEQLHSRLLLVLEIMAAVFLPAEVVSHLYASALEPVLPGREFPMVVAVAILVLMLIGLGFFGFGVVSYWCARHAVVNRLRRR